MISSESSLLGAMPPRPTLRESTSAPISKVIVSSSRHASSSRASSRRPYQRDSVAISGPPGRSAAPSVGLGEELLQLRPVLGALTNDPGPAGLVGLVAVGLPDRAVEADGLNAGVGLALGVLGVLLGENARRLGFRLLPRLAQNIALRLGELVPDGLVHQDRHFGGVEAGVDAVLGLLVPSEIEDTGDRPSITIHHTALQRRIDLAWRGLHDRCSQCLEEVAIDRRDAELQADEIGSRDRL